ncbi:MAG: DUF6456 domain-containing protein [Methyloceanibacter sp.]|nr:DUF6456 domain-containing protein [Methyloceanibacter sp.]
MTESLHPTQERLAKGDAIDWEDTEVAGAKVARVRTQTVLDHYFFQEKLTRRQYDAGQRFYALWRAAGRGTNTSCSYDPKVQNKSRQISDTQAEAHTHYVSIMKDLGPTISAIVISVCCINEAPKDTAVSRGEEARAGKAVLRLALDALADAFGMPLD